VSENDSDSSIIANWENEIVHHLPSYSNSEQCANEDDDETPHSPVRKLTKIDITPCLGPFTGNLGVKKSL
jgi:hypothetical protein